MLPPLAIRPTFLPARSSFSAAASGAAPAGSIRFRVRSSMCSVARAELVLGDEHEVVEVLAEDLLRELEADAGGEALGRGVHLVLDECRLPSTSGRRRARPRTARRSRASSGLQRGGGDAGAGGAAAAADRHDQHVELGLPLERLERVRADAGDQVRLVSGVDVAVAVLRRERLAVLAGVVEVAAVLDDLGRRGRGSTRP